ncbi:glycosyltransferase [Methylocystis iwaonis]|uniref:Glycosyltransferase 2-like domain-containing protein n=1 Tax=Methylocystis iwaonis TaxID=2885079 RepID=A0ABM8E4D7_9HYPH|nr:glycosyltransferase [Methylocystis iwaonis]BDV32742.1 hypothetical protein SS37A_02710 [Methylocystis iwaonis]
MPTYQGQRWIDAALRSVAAEPADGIEILVLDSSPNSETLDIVRRYDSLLNLRVMKRDEASMWHAQTNIGAERAEAEHLCWLHQDDLWLPGRIEAIRKWIEKAPNAALHLAPSVIVDADGRTLGLWRCPLEKDAEIDSSEIVQRLIVQNFVSAPAPVFRKDAWLFCGGLDEALWYTADWDMWLKLAALGPVHYHSEATTAFRVHNSSLTVTGAGKIEEFSQQMQIVFDRHLPTLAEIDNCAEAAGRASIRVNAALAAASGGDFSLLAPAVAAVLGLGPLGVARYLRDSRIYDRMAPRLRAKFAGAF